MLLTTSSGLPFVGCVLHRSTNTGHFSGRERPRNPATALEGRSVSLPDPGLLTTCAPLPSLSDLPHMPWLLPEPAFQELDSEPQPTSTVLPAEGTEGFFPFSQDPATLNGPPPFSQSAQERERIVQILLGNPSSFNSTKNPSPLCIAAQHQAYPQHHDAPGRATAGLPCASRQPRVLHFLLSPLLPSSLQVTFQGSAQTP